MPNVVSEEQKHRADVSLLRVAIEGNKFCSVHRLKKQNDDEKEERVNSMDLLLCFL